MLDSTCSVAGCNFVFNGNDTSPTLSTLSSTTMTTGPLSLTGLRFDIGSRVAVSFTNAVTGKVT